MVSVWPESVERVAAFLRAAGAEARLEEFFASTPTAAAAAEAVGCAPNQIVKSLVLLCDGRQVIALVPGDRRGDLEKIRAAVAAETARPASPDEVERLTGFAPGAVAPFPSAADRILIDRRLLARPLVWVGGGSPQHLVALAPAELARLTRAEPMDVVEEPAYHSSPETADKET
jgi:prolyl-tRNA editing enzyme YbaK/EbsC (Cys-tRNA(Pro) deacylase)